MREKKPAPFAMCVCGEPLICTLAWSKYEFYCLCCGRHYDWLGPHSAEPTPEIQARFDELNAEWEKIAPALIGGGTMLRDCETCRKKYEPHWNHATAEERAAHEAAITALRERAQGAIA